MSAPVPIFTGAGHIGYQADRRILRIDDMDAYRAYLDRCPEGEALDLEIRPREETRRAQANRYLFGVVYALMEKETGQPKDSIHEDMKRRFLTKTTVRWVNYKTGEIFEDQVTESSAIQSISGFGKFIEDVRLFAQEWLGLYTPDPDPDYREKRRKKAA